MKKEKKHYALFGGLKAIVAVAAVAAVIIFFSGALDNLSKGQSDEGLRQLEEAVRRGCVSCYATEGVYPPTIEYLEERYGVQIDRERYTVHYDIFAENLMPDILVLPRVEVKE